MPFEFTPLEITGAVLIAPRVFPDERGFFMETYKHSEFASHGIPETFVQCNHAKSSEGILRGLHYQKNPKAQGKLVRALKGEIYDVAVDMRSGSPTFGKWFGASLSSENRSMLYVPPGFAHGYCVISETAEILYMATDEYAPSYEAGVAWNDPDLMIPWPVDNPRLSVRDRAWPRLRDADHNFVYEGTPTGT